MLWQAWRQEEAYRMSFPGELFEHLCRAGHGGARRARKR